MHKQSVLPLMHVADPARRAFLPSPLSTLIALCIILYLLQHPVPEHAPQATLTTPSQFRSRAAPSSYSSARGFAAYPWGQTCSPPARERYLRRFDTPHRPFGLRYVPLSREQSRNRVLVSAVPHEVGDGLGHRMCILNYELHLALALGVSYSHRVSSYGSLSVENPAAVEQLFGWGIDEMTRDDVLASGCANVKLVNDTCEIPSENVVCSRLRHRDDGGMFDRVVMIPDEVAECYLDRTQPKELTDERCYPLVRRFVAAFPEPNTLFQMRPKLCFRDYLYTNFSQTVGWFHDKYWTAHSHEHDRLKQTGLLSADIASAMPADIVSAMEDDESLPHAVHRSTLSMDATVADTSFPTRNISYSPDRVHIALHVRRGDFFNYTSRVLISDATYADLAARVKVALDEMHAANVPVTVHVYSEGVPRARGRVKDNHDVGSMDRVYANEHGLRMPDNHWYHLVHRNVRLSSSVGVGRGLRRPDIQVETHIATDTVQALHEMLAADFFVGSVSGLSVQVVRHIARGLTLLPLPRAELMPDEFAVNFDYDRNEIASFVNETALYGKVAHYARLNRLACSVW